MKIKKIKINGYGTLIQKEIEFSDGINIIYGKNESGKSTLLNYIKSSFYGISKTKNKKEISDYEKYLPWKTNEYSGKIIYELDNGKEYQIYRDFNKKDPKIYDENLEEISSKFKNDKKDGNLFFVEQTNVEEEMFLSTIVSMQGETKLTEQNQAILIQKLANLAGTGNDKISYKKIMEKLNKKQIEEIGTERTTERPINLIDENIKKIEIKINELKNKLNKINELENKKIEINKKIKEKENKLNAIKEIENYLKELEIEKEKINIKINEQKELEKQIEKMEEEKNKIEHEKNQDDKKSSSHILQILYISIFIFSVLGVIFLKQTFWKVICGGIAVVDIIWVIANRKIQQNKVKKYQNDKKKEEETVKMKLECLKSNRQFIKTDVGELERRLDMNADQMIEKTAAKYVESLSKNEILEFFEKRQ